MTSPKILLLAAAAAFTLAGPMNGAALAQEPVNPLPPTADQPTPAPDPSRATTTPPADSAGEPSSANESNWIGVMVIDSAGKKVGRIEKVVTGTEGGAPDQVQLRVRGKTVVIPTATLTLEGGNAVSTLPMSQIETSAPGNR
ncbi:MAG: hypothetical protein JWP35_4827 [Caulobacter sp.]|nr:hypothetical protein [Caulobacter sp.]